MHLVPTTERVSSLFKLTLEAVNALIRGSNIKGEDDIKSAKGYLDQLPSTIKLRIAKSWSQELNDCFWIEPDLDRTLHNYALWKVTCFWPNEKGALLNFRIMHCHFGIQALQYVTELCSVQEIKNSAVIIENHPWPYLFNCDDARYECSSRFNSLLSMSHCTSNLTEVTMKGDIEDSCLKSVGEQCKNLRRLILDGRHLTNDGFVSFASNQAKNPAFAELTIKESKITFRGLATVWQLPLPISILVCNGKNFRHDNGDVIDVEALMQCPNGPSVLTDLCLDWGLEPTNDVSATIRKMLFKSNLLFPNLKRMLWSLPPGDLFASGRKWEAVEAFNQVFSSKLKLEELATNFPNVISMCLMSITPLTAFNSLESGSFDFLTRFEFLTLDFQVSLPFMTFRAILAKAKNIRIVKILVSAVVIDQYTDGPFCHMLHTLEHLKNLEWLEVLSDSRQNKINLTQTSLSCILNTCSNIRMLRDLMDWNVDPESVLHNNKGYQWGCQKLYDRGRHGYHEAYPFSRYNT